MHYIYTIYTQFTATRSNETAEYEQNFSNNDIHNPHAINIKINIRVTTSHDLEDGHKLLEFKHGPTMDIHSKLHRDNNHKDIH